MAHLKNCSLFKIYQLSCGYNNRFQMRPNFDDGFKLEPIKINERASTTTTTTSSNVIGRSNDNFDSISLDSGGDVTDGIKKYVSVAIVV